MFKSLLASAMLALAPLHAAAQAPMLWNIPSQATAPLSEIEIAIPADYTAWVSMDVQRLFALNPGERAELSLPGLGHVSVVFEGIRPLDAAGKAMEWQAHVADRPDDKLTLVRGMHGSVSGILNIHGDRLLLGQANDEYLLYRAGTDTPSAIADRPQAIAPLALVETDRLDKPAAVAFPVSVDLVGLSSLPLGAEAELTLPETGTFTMVHDNTLPGDMGASTFVGYLKDYGDDFRVIITSSQTGSIGSILTPHGEFKLLMKDGQAWVVDVSRSGLKSLEPNHDDGVASLPDALPDNGGPVPVAQAAGALSMQQPRAQAGLTQKGNTARAQSAAATGTTDTVAGKTTIDILVFYSAGLETKLGASQALARIQHLVALSNQAYLDSKVDISLRLAKAVKLDALSDTTSNSQLLSDMANGKGAFSQLKALRAQHGADLVSVVRPFRMKAHGGNCGLGYVGGYGASPISYYNNHALSVVSDGNDVEGSRYYCTDYTFTHELGHNMGSMHDRTTVASQGGGIGAYPYSFGYGQSGQFGSIMSYISPVIGKFSNPDLNTCGNKQACGISSTASNSADNARSLNNTRGAVSSFMQASAAQPLFISGIASSAGKALPRVVISGAGAKCTPSATNGRYSCEVANGWSGTLQASLSGYAFSPASKAFSKLSASQVNQNWSATAVKANKQARR